MPRTPLLWTPQRGDLADWEAHGSHVPRPPTAEYSSSPRPTNALDVAEHLLKRAGSMTAMKLQKLLYYSQAWSLVWRDKPLFSDAIQAWAAGPVVRTVYNQHKGRFSLNVGDIEGAPRPLTDDEAKVCEIVLAHYGSLTAEELSELTHREQPWQVARAGMSDTERGNREIDPSVMVDFYTSLSRSQPQQR